MKEQVWRGRVASATSRNRDGSERIYNVTLAADGTGTCTCADYIIRGVNGGNPDHRCKHIRAAAPNLSRVPAVRISDAQKRAIVSRMVDRAIIPTGTRRPSDTVVIPPPVPPAPATPRRTPLGLSDDDIRRTARRGRPEIE